MQGDTLEGMCLPYMIDNRQIDGKLKENHVVNGMKAMKLFFEK